MRLKAASKDTTRGPILATTFFAKALVARVCLAASFANVLASTVGGGALGHQGEGSGSPPSGS